MAKVTGDKTFFHGKSESTGVLLVNLGTPDEPTTSAVRKYLREFLSDSRVVEIPRLVWLPILHAFVLPKRPAKSAENYKKVWSKEKGSPLLYISQRQEKLLQQEMESRFAGPVHIALAMRYGKPDIESGLKKLQEKGMQRLLILPLYPQYSATTTATTFDKIAQIFKGWRRIPEYRFISQYHDYPAYINALANSVKAHWKEHGQHFLLMSFHGLPKRNLDLGDPYFCHCHKTSRLVAEKLGLKNSEWQLSFQSRFGKAEWLQPYTDKTLMELPEKGIKSLDVICPGFPSDCLETLEEIEGENKAYFLEAGGENYHYIPALNDHAEHIHMLADLIQLHTQGWTETAKGWAASAIEKNNDLSQKRAKIKGAEF